jgi:hypothetical protein
LARYLARETERGREAPTMEELLGQVRANSKLVETDKAQAESEARSAAAELAG